MAKFLVFLILFLIPTIASARIFNVHCPRFTIQGRVYCDTCLAGFETAASTYIHGATVRVECNDEDTLELLYEVEGVTDESGTYTIQVEGGHGDQLCEVFLVSSPLSDCATIDKRRERAIVYPASDDGIASNQRYAISLSFLKDSPMAGCSQLLKHYQYFD